MTDIHFAKGLIHAEYEEEPRLPKLGHWASVSD